MVGPCIVAIDHQEVSVGYCIFGQARSIQDRGYVSGFCDARVGWQGGVVYRWVFKDGKFACGVYSTDGIRLSVCGWIK
ncbi:hypothetical protein 7711_00054 [Pseudomonas phage bmx-p1]|nr:hypothetical protein 7711_00054 [Pseudomonas phage bmx-p1]